MIYCIIHSAADAGRWRDSYGSPCGHVAGMTKEEMQMRKQLRRWCSLLLTLVMVVSLLPTAVFADSSSEAQTYSKITSEADLTTGQYVLVTDTGYAPGVLDGTWVTAIQPTVSDDRITGPAEGVWTLTVTESGVQMTDAKGTTIAPSGGNNNGIKSGSYDWAVMFSNGTFRFCGTGEDTVTLASNKGSQNKFRAYKNATIEKTPGGYPCDFTLYKLDSAEPARENGVVAVSDLQDGDTVVVFNPAYGKTLSTEYSGFYNTAADVTLADGKLTGWGESDLWTVGINDDGTYTFATSEGKKLSMQDDNYTSTPLDGANPNWKITAVDGKDAVYYIDNAVRTDKYRLQYYASKGTWSAYTGTGDAFEQQFYLVVDKGTDPTPDPDPDPTPSAALKDGKYVIYNPGSGKAMSADATGTYYRAGKSVTVTDGKVSNPSADLIWNVSSENGVYTITTASGSKLSMNDEKNSLPLDEKNDTWTIEEAKTEGCYYIINATRKGSSGDPYYVEWYANTSKGFEEFSTYFYNEANESIYALQFIPAETSDTPSTDLPKPGDKFVIYNQNAGAVLAAENDQKSIEKAAAVIADGKATPENGAVVFTVEQNGEYLRFYSEAYGYLCSNGTGNNAFYSKDFSEDGVSADDADWLVRTCSGGVGGYEMESRTAKYSGHSQWLEYYSDAFKTYSMYKVTDYTIYSFFFYPVAEGVNVDGGLVVQPTITFPETMLDAYVGADYEFSLSLDTLYAIDDPWIEYSVKKADGTYIPGISQLQGNTDVEVLDGFTSGKGEAHITVFAGDIAEAAKAGDTMTLTFAFKDIKGNEARASYTVRIVDAPVISNMTPAQGAQTGENKRPVISADVANAGENPTVELKLNDAAVNVSYADGKVSYTPSADLADGRVKVTLTVTRTDGKSTSASWSFTVGASAFQLYFGQMHSHTQYSDGAGTLDSALSYIRSLPESANVQFVAFTDHSNYFDSKNDPNVEAALYDASLVKDSDASHSWATYKKTVADFNADPANSDLVAIAGFEMTWSGGPGHINTFNTAGVVSRNNSTLNNKTDDAGMKAYYALLSQEEGADSISQFNHPGTTFGNFKDFAYWDPVIDSRMYTVEVGNGEGQIGAGGYYPSYEQYIMALDKGWHVAPTNNQDNHKGRWGNANDARDVILTDDFTEQGIYEAIRNYRVYATEDKNLELGYTVNGEQMGTILSEVPEKLSFNISVYDPDKTDSIASVELVVNSGKVAYSWSKDEIAAAGGILTTELAPDYSYYFVRVTESDGDIAVTAPVWVGETLRLGISNAECGTSMPVTDEELTITTTFFNSEATAATIKSISYSIDGQSIGTDTTGYTLSASSTLPVDFKYTPTKARVITIDIAATLEQNGKEYTFTKSVELDVSNAADLVYIGIDASHYNEYVAGNYKDSMGNFGNLAAEYSVRTVELKTSDELIAACGSDKYKAIIFTAPSRRLAAAQSDPKTYSADELAAIKAFNDKGGTVILAGWSDNYENYDVIQSNPGIKHMAATQNEILETLGSHLRISDDATYDDVRSAADGVDKWRLYFSSYNMDNPLLAGVEVDPDHPYDKLYTERFSHYGGASVYAVDESGNATSTLPATVSPVVYGHATTYSVDVDNDGLGGAGIPKYAYADGDSRLMVMATEQLAGKGQIIVSGAAFMSNFEVQAQVDNAAEKNYSNYKICENLVSQFNQAKITDIDTVRRQTESGYKFTVEGIVTSNASGYDKNTAFFDCIYVQDETGGINAFPVAGDFKVGDKVRITGKTDFYQGEIELQVTTITRIGEGFTVTPKDVTAAQVNGGSVLGELVKIKGTITRVESAEGKIQTIMVKDSAGNETRIFIDGYITPDTEVVDAKVGYTVEAVGLASYDNTFVLNDGTPVYPRIRIRDRADIVCTKGADQPVGPVTPVNPGKPSTPTTPDKPTDGFKFTDVSRNDWFYGDVSYVYENGIMDGVSAETFAPNATLTRGMIVTILYRMENKPAVTGASKFTDVDANEWYGAPVAWAAENGIVTGYSETTFGPNDPVTREQLAAILYRYAVYKGMSAVTREQNLSRFTDADQISAYAVPAMNWAVGKGLINGADGKLSPKASATRAQVAAIIHRYLEG